MHNNDSNPSKTANQQHIEALDADYRACRTMMDEIMDTSLSDAEAMSQLLIDLGPIEEIDLGPIEEIDFGPIEEIDFGSMPALDLSEISYDEATATLANRPGMPVQPTSEGANCLPATLQALRQPTLVIRGHPSTSQSECPSMCWRRFVEKRPASACGTSD